MNTMTKTEELLTQIKDIFIKSKRGSYIEKREFEFGDLIGYIVDTPRKYKDMYHGSSYEIGCNRTLIKCNIGGDLSTKRDLENSIKEKLTKLSCNVIDVHRHPEDVLFQDKKDSEIKMKESHIHFRCDDKNIKDTFKILNFIKDN